MLIKKKKEVEIELTEEELKTIEAIKMFQTRIENLKSDLVLGTLIPLVISKRNRSSAMS